LQHRSHQGGADALTAVARSNVDFLQMGVIDAEHLDQSESDRRTAQESDPESALALGLPEDLVGGDLLQQRCRGVRHEQAGGSEFDRGQGNDVLRLRVDNPVAGSHRSIGPA
jgi:hypothetical protein